MIVEISIIIYVLFMLLVGLYSRHKVKTSSDYVLAGRSLPFYMATATVFATWFGSESILGASASFAESGFRGVLEDPFGAALCLILAGIFFNRKLYKFNFLTIGDYFHHRYNVLISTFLSTIIIISYFGWVAAQFLALGLVISIVIPGISLFWAILFSASIVLAYTFFGGMYSIAVLDTIESFVIIIGLFVTLVYVAGEVGGFNTLISSASPDFWHVLPENKGSFTEWTIFGTAIITMGFGSIPQQDIYQRAMSAKSATISVWASITGGFLYLTIVMIPLLIALGAKILYPDVLLNHPEQLVLNLIINNTPGWLKILFFGALISAIISTASGALLAPGTLLAENIIKPFFKEIPDNYYLRIIRLAVIIVTIGGVILALNSGASIYGLVRGAYSITLVTAFVPLVFGLYSRHANSFGAMLSIVLGISFWQFMSNVFPHSEIPAIFIGFIASVIGMIIGIIRGKYLVLKKNNVISHRTDPLPKV